MYLNFIGTLKYFEILFEVQKLMLSHQTSFPVFI